MTEPLRGDALYQHLKGTIEENAAGIVSGLMDAAKGGGYMAARFLFEFARIGPAESAADGGASLFSLLWQRLQEPPPESATSAAVPARDEPAVP